MSDRIKEIIDESGFFDDSELHEISETVIEECIRIIEDAVDTRQPASTYANLIRQHFGVK